jgi:nitrate/nitrite transport system ATP-binding protein
MHAQLLIENAGIEFPARNGPFRALSDVNLKVAEGEFLSIIGHSGCGKSTILNIVAGLLRPTEGVVLMEGREVCEPGPDRAVVFQNHSLLPWLTVYENVRLAVDKVWRRRTGAERDQWTRHNLERVHMAHALDKRPNEISGGMKQRVGMVTHDVDEAVLLSDRIVMMTNGPAATIGEILKIDLPRPRERLEMADSPQYNHYRAEVLRFLYDRHRNPREAA